MTTEEMRKVKFNFDLEECKMMLECAGLMNQIFEETIEYDDAVFEADGEEHYLAEWARETYIILTQFAHNGCLKFDTVTKS